MNKSNTKEDFVITLHLTNTQCKVLINSLRSTTRLLLGDYSELKEISYRPAVGFVDHDEFYPITKQLMRLFHPDLVRYHGYNSNWGIGNKKIPNADILFDIAKILEYNISWRDHPLGGWGVNFDQPFGWSGYPLKAEFINSTDNIYVSFFNRFHHSINQMITKMEWQRDSVEVTEWIEKCKQFALYENNHITTTQTPLPSNEYLEFFNEQITPDGKYIEWKPQ